MPPPACAGELRSSALRGGHRFPGATSSVRRRQAFLSLRSLVSFHGYLVLLSADRREADNCRALAGTETARGACDSLSRVGRTHHNRAPLGRPQVVPNVTGE